MSRARRDSGGWTALAAQLLVFGLPVFAVAGCRLAGAAPSFAAVAAPRGAAEVFNYDRFGPVTVYHGRGRPHDVVLLLAGDGLNAATAALAQRLADRGALVAGIDFRHYRESLDNAHEACVSPDSDLENLSHYLQSKVQLQKYLVPILVGTHAGATLAYASLAVAPEGLFKGALSIGFSPGLDVQKALCDSPAMTARLVKDSGGAAQGVIVSAAKRLPGKWIVLQPLPAEGLGRADAAVREFVAAVPGAELVEIPSSAEGTVVSAAALPQLDAAYARLAALRTETKGGALPPALADLPLIVVPTAPGGAGAWFGVFLTGDGGWVGLDKGVSLELAKHDIPIVGWDSLKYFWRRRTPEGASHDLDRVLRYYAHAWGRSHALLIGYSQGADTMPFMINRLPAATRQLVGYTTLLGISDNALWEFHVATWFGSPAKGMPTAPELADWKGAPYLCIYGESDEDAACAEETGHDGTALKLAGGHHFGGGYARIADEILMRLPPVTTAGTPPSVVPVPTAGPIPPGSR